jgi:hypothetical protein
MAKIRRKKTEKSGGEIIVRKDREFELYVIWKSLPARLLRSGPEELKALGIEEETLRELVAIKTQGDFAKKFGIRHLGTLTDWNAKIEEAGLMNGTRAWAKKLTANVLLAFYRQALVEGDAARVKAWMQIVEEMRLDEPLAGQPAGPALHLHFHNEKILKLVKSTEDRIAQEIDKSIK